MPLVDCRPEPSAAGGRGGEPARHSGRGPACSFANFAPRFQCNIRPILIDRVSGTMYPARGGEGSINCMNK
jgi:hypothetical protein